MATTVSAAAIAERGRKVYREQIQAQVERHHRGDYLALDIVSGDYFLAPDEESALEQMEERRPAGTFYLLRVGYSASLFVGAQAA